MGGDSPKRICISVSVRELSEFVWRRGDLRGNRGGPSALEGARAHRWLQGERDEYESERFFRDTYQQGALTLTLSGRADLVCATATPPEVEEIKTTLESPLLVDGTNRVHWAQVKLYGYMFAKAESLAEVVLKVTYLNVETRQMRTFVETVPFEALVSFFEETATRYLDWMAKVAAWRRRRDRALQGMAFPFESPRVGQLELAEQVRAAAAGDGRLFVEAPTGSGKTMAVLFGGIGSLADGSVSQLLFLTAKSMGREAAVNGAAVLTAGGARLKVLTLLSKANTCLEPPSTPCANEACPLAAGHYDRLGGAMAELFSRDDTAPETVAAVAATHGLCPYWLARALIPFVDIVIGDYNYFFSPGATLQALSGRIVPPRLLLVDEAHNLPDRAREMFSASLTTETLRKMGAHLDDRFAFLRSVAARLEKAVLETGRGGEPRASASVSNGERRRNDANQRVLESLPAPVTTALAQLMDGLGAALGTPGIAVPEPLLSGYFELVAFHRAVTTGDAGDRLICSVETAGGRLQSFCLDPASRLRGVLTKSGARSVFFSATLSPAAYYRRLLGGDAADVCAVYPPLFPRENRFAGVAVRLSTRYRDRERTKAGVAELIRRLVLARPGNYLAFFPSFAYLETVAAALDFGDGKVEVLRQRPGFDDGEKRAFLDRFRTRRRTRRLVGLAVLGGLFGEGVDLPGHQLIGAVVVGPGLPKITFERELIRSYFSEEEGRGFEFAYLYPGMNKVVQAAGRVLRSGSDKGAVLFVGERFAGPGYAELLRSAWPGAVRVETPEGLSAALDRFWMRTDGAM